LFDIYFTEDNSLIMSQFRESKIFTSALRQLGKVQ
jgi:hypothetical protein